MSTIPRVSSAVPGEPAHFGSVLAHQPLLAARFGEAYGAFWNSDLVSARTKELCRMRNARITQCGFCRQVRFDKPFREGLDEAAIADVTDDYAQSDVLSVAEKAALRFTDALIHDPALFDGTARAELHRHFTPAQIEELGIGIAMFLALAKVLITLGLEPDEMGTTVLPTPQLAETTGDRPLSVLFDEFAEAARTGLDPVIAAAVTERIAQIHAGPIAPLGDGAGIRDLLPFVDNLPFAHHTISDEQAAAARDALGEEGFVALAVHAALSDARCRLDPVMQAVERPAEAIPAS